jgi:hypothetical protein
MKLKTWLRNRMVPVFYLTFLNLRFCSIFPNDFSFFFRPTRLFRHATRLPENRWKRELDGYETDITSLSITFRTLNPNSVLLRATSNGLAYTEFLLKEDGVLEYRSKSSSSSSNDVILDTEVSVNDGSWHTATIQVSGGNVLHFLVDDVKVGYEVEFSGLL